MKKTLLLSIESWFHRVPYHGFLQSPHKWVVFHPLYQTTNQGFFHCSSGHFQVLPLFVFGGAKLKTWKLPTNRQRSKERFYPQGFTQHLEGGPKNVYRWGEITRFIEVRL